MVIHADLRENLECHIFEHRHVVKIQKNYSHFPAKSSEISGGYSNRDESFKYQISDGKVGLDDLLLYYSIQVRFLLIKNL